ncbi:MAG TPA: exosortase/archaeosortase family protein [Phycisphaerae bacterium]|nr:exosortase/archaeosortase family protein [Phycisphaerae bacterium]HNU43709.1 exosortase/archaeosortase family protein [Phycisphaerae bacterium]
MPSLLSAERAVPRSWGEFIPPAARVQLAVVAALVLMTYASPIRSDLVWKWTHDGNWSHGWLVPLFSLYFLVTHREEVFASVRRPNYLGAVVIAGSLAVYLACAWWLQMSYPQAVSMLGVLFGLVLLFGGWGLLRVTWFPIGFLLLAVPLPESVYVEVTMPLRMVSSVVAAKVMPLFASGLYTEPQGVVIDYVMAGGRPGSLNVEEACSGMRLMMAFVTLGVAMAYLGDRPVWQRVIMVISCAPIAIICNALRVTITGLLHVYGYEEYGRGTAHQLLGIGMLVVALGLYALTGYVLSHLVVEEPETEDGETAD